MSAEISLIMPSRVRFSYFFLHNTRLKLTQLYNKIFKSTKSYSKLFTDVLLLQNAELLKEKTFFETQKLLILKGLVKVRKGKRKRWFPESGAASCGRRRIWLVRGRGTSATPPRGRRSGGSGGGGAATGLGGSAVGSSGGSVCL